MPDREMVIKGLERLIGTAGCVAIYDSDCKSCPYKHVNGCVDQVLEDALELLKAQEPVKPVVDVDTWTCGNCRHTLEHQELLGDNVLFHEQYDYCPMCGRKVKWDE